jgi:hypothetical protein
MSAPRWAPDVWVTVESSGRTIKLHKTANRWFVESIRFKGSELLSEETPMSEANPALASHLDALAHLLLED